MYFLEYLGANALIDPTDIEIGRLRPWHVIRLPQIVLVAPDLQREELDIFCSGAEVHLLCYFLHKRVASVM